MDYGTIKLISVLTAYIARVIEVKGIFYVFYICFVLIRFMINDRIDRSIDRSKGGEVDVALRINTEKYRGK